MCEWIGLTLLFQIVHHYISYHLSGHAKLHLLYHLAGSHNFFFFIMGEDCWPSSTYFSSFAYNVIQVTSVIVTFVRKLFFFL